MYESFFKTFNLVNKGNIEPSCYHNAHFLKSIAALNAVEIGMVAILLCFWIYKAVSDHIYANFAKKTL